MKKAFLIAAAAIALSGCQYIPGTPQHNVEAAKSVVAAQLKDPASAQFTEVSVVPGAVCGFVNGKNSFGAYAGAQRFVRSTVSDQTFLENGSRPLEPYAAAAHDSEQCAVRRSFDACKAGRSAAMGTVRVACAAELAGVSLG